MNRISAIIFDMDGVIIDSEPLWRRAESDVFQGYGIPISEQMCHQTTGLRIDEVVSYWLDKYPIDVPPSEIERAILDRVIGQIAENGEPMPGAVELINGLAQQGYPLAICSSSPMRLIDAVVNKFSLRAAFKALISAEHLSYGKPHPEVYLQGAAALGVAPTSCLAIEDSVNGVIAAKAARMVTIAIPEPSQAALPAFAVADGICASLIELGHSMPQWLAPQQA